MSAFSIFTHDNDPTEDPILDPPAPAVLSYQRPSTDAPQIEIAESQPSLPSGALEEDPLPEVVLRLPDLTMFQPVAPDRQPRLASWLYWVGIALGALFALWLIWTPKESAPPRDEAPAWSPLPPVDHSAPAQNVPSPGGGADRANEVPATSGRSDGPSLGSEPGAALGVPQSPASGLSGTGGPSAEVRTARGGESRWFGNPLGVKPSEAAPLGISTPEPR
jgi:hypothetical protein